MHIDHIKLIAERINTHMCVNAIKARDAAAKSGLSESTISEIRHGSDKRISYYLILAEAINLPTQSLFNTQLTNTEMTLVMACKKLNNEQLQALNTFLNTLI